MNPANPSSQAAGKLSGVLEDRRSFSSKPRALDLFCGAGGATKGLQRAGFHVTGVDNRPMPRYCGDEFYQGDALDPPVRPEDFDFIWASPPCQVHVSLRWMHNAKSHADLIPQTREKLNKFCGLWCIENVPGADTLNTDIILCGSMFGLGSGDAELRRHRHFEANFPIIYTPPCSHKKPRVIGVYGGHGRDRRRTHNTQDFSIADRREAMGIDWMTGKELSQAIPPAYSFFIGIEAIRQISLLRAAT